MPFLTDSCQMKLHHAATYGPSIPGPPSSPRRGTAERRCEIGSISALAVTFAVPLISTTLLISPSFLRDRIVSTHLPMHLYHKRVLTYRQGKDEEVEDAGTNSRGCRAGDALEGAGPEPLPKR